ncbi:MAG: chondroitinase-B domain-containing protein [Opitutaceae bacterium]
MERSRNITRRIALLLCIGALGNSGLAKEWPVSSAQQFDSTLNLASPGDEIVWEDGIYSDVDLTLDQDRLVFRAETPGGVIFKGESKLNLTGDGNTVNGFRYVNSNVGPKGVILNVEGSYNTFTEIDLRNCRGNRYLNIRSRSQHNTFEYCNFSGFNFLPNDPSEQFYYAGSAMINIITEDGFPSYATFRRCSLKDVFLHESSDVTNHEAIKVGSGAQGPGGNENETPRQWPSHCLVEYCYFENCEGDPEIITSKSEGNIYRYNTFYSCADAGLTLRNGWECVVYGNFFIGGGRGVRVKNGSRSVIFNNYFDGVMQPIKLEFDRGGFAGAPGEDWTLRDVTIANNTFVNAQSPWSMGLQEGEPSPENIVIANNLFHQGNEVWREITRDGFEFPQKRDGTVGDWGSFKDTSLADDDCMLENHHEFAAEGVFSVRLRDDTDASILEQDSAAAYDLSAYAKLQVTFDALSVDQRSGDSFDLQFYDGSDWQTVKRFAYGDDYGNGLTFLGRVSFGSDDGFTFGSDCRIRFKNKTADDTRKIYFDTIVVSGLSSGEIFAGETGNEKWIGNIYNIESGSNDVLGLAQVPSRGLDGVDPKLVLNGYGHHQIGETSPAIDAAVGSEFIDMLEIPYFQDLDDSRIELDLMKNRRNSPNDSRDVGAFEYSAHAAAVKPHATADNTGPSYLGILGDD